MAARVVIRQLSKAFRGVRAVDTVDATVEAGSIHSVIGPNGAGKTTLLNCISGFLPVDAGRIQLGDRDVTHLRPHELVRAGVVRTFQITTLFDGLSVRENVELAACSALGRNLDMRHSAAALSDVDEVADAVMTNLDLIDKADLRAEQLAHGDRRVLEMAVALALGPRVLLLDEPTAGMSRTERTRIAELIRGLAPECTVVLVEHDTEIVLSISHKVSVMVQGRIIAEGPPKEISESAAVREAYLGAAT